jgi:hypothetical protein
MVEICKYMIRKEVIRKGNSRFKLKNNTRKSGYNTYRGWTQTEYQNKDYNINQVDEKT